MSVDWPAPSYPGEVLDIGHDAAMELLGRVPADQRVYTVAEILEMLDSWGRPIDDKIVQKDLDDYVEHMAAGGYVIGRPA